MAAFMISLAVSQFAYGPLSEVIGRRIALFIGLFIMILGSTVCAFAVDLPQLMIGRFIQGAGAGACAFLWAIRYVYFLHMELSFLGLL